MHIFAISEARGKMTCISGTFQKIQLHRENSLLCRFSVPSGNQQALAVPKKGYDSIIFPPHVTCFSLNGSWIRNGKCLVAQLNTPYPDWELNYRSLFTWLTMSLGMQYFLCQSMFIYIYLSIYLNCWYEGRLKSS